MADPMPKAPSVPKVPSRDDEEAWTAWRDRRMSARWVEHSRGVKGTESRQRLMDELKTSRKIVQLGSRAGAFEIVLKAGGTSRLKIVDLHAAPKSGVQGAAEAFTWDFFAADDGYYGPPVPPLAGRRGSRLGALRRAPLINLAKLRGAAEFSGDDAYDLYSRLEIAAERTEGIEGDPIKDKRKEIGEALAAGEAADLIAIDVDVSRESAYNLLLSGPDPIENVSSLLVQMLSTLRSLNDSVGFVHGLIDLTKISVTTLVGPHELVYDTPDESVQVIAGGPEGVSRFSFVELAHARLGSDVIDSLLRFGFKGARENAALEWARDWEDRKGSGSASHALDLHALGIGVLEVIAWRVSNVDEPVKVKDKLWLAARFCLDRLMLAKGDFKRGRHRAFGKAYSIDTREIYALYRAEISKVLKLRRSATGNARLAELIFASYGDLGIDDETTLAEMTSDPEGVRNNDVFDDFVLFTKHAVSRNSARGARRLDYWTHEYFR